MIKVIPHPLVPLRKPWKQMITVGRAYDLLREDLLSHLRQAQKEIGYRYCRFHAVFHDDMRIVERKPDGQLQFQWHHLDKVYDSLLDMGLKPFVELNPMPAALASGEQTMFHYGMNVTPPKDYGEWEALLRAFGRHMIDRYGQEEVEQWYFEVWNEPNLSGFWSGTKDEYFQLYDASARALKALSPKLRVGGPASSKAQWIQDIIDHCEATGVPLDFVSTHLYPQDEYVTYKDRKGSPHEIGMYFQDQYRAVQQLVANSARPDLQIFWTEWNTMSTDASERVRWLDNPCVDSLYAASFIARNCIELDEASDGMGYWTVSDIFEESPIPNAPFSCTYGLLSNLGIPKAAYQAFSFLNRLQGDVLPVDFTDKPTATCGGVVTRSPERVHLLFWHHQPLEEKSLQPWKDTVTVPLGSLKNPQVLSGRITEKHGSAWESWVQMGSPVNLSPAAEALLRQHAEPLWAQEEYKTEADQLSLSIQLKPGEVLYLEISAKQDRAFGKGTGGGNLAEWDRLMGEQSR